ncbi:MAG: NAD(P)/FAD-dependent oxidoreductase [Pseudomonadota bacterium]
MGKAYDVVIVGGGAIGSAIAYFLAGETDFRGRVLVVEKDPSYAEAATGRSAGGIRQQFSTPENIRMSLFGARFLKSIGEHLAVDGEAPEISFVEGGYLFLADAAGLAVLKRNHEVQVANGADIALLTPGELHERFPWLAARALAGGALGLKNEGWFDPYALLQAFKRKARSLGVAYAADEAIGLTRAGSRMTGVRLAKGGEVPCAVVVNAAGPAAADIAAMAGLPLPVRPRKRFVYVFDCRTPVAGAPLVTFPDGVYFRPEGAHFIAGVSPHADRDQDCRDFEIDTRPFEEVVWPSLARLVPAFAAIQLVRAWAGHYDYNTLDQNAILGPHPEIANFFFANGFSGHGLQQAPAAGRCIAELVAYGAYRSLDLSRFSYRRVIAGEAIPERNVV